MTAPLTVLQISDCHLQATPAAKLLDVDTAASLEAVLDAAFARRVPDALIASGDLAHDPEPTAYRRLRRMIEQRFAGPVLYLPGNHDRGVPLVDVLGSQDTLAVGDWQVLGFDTHVDDQPEAGFDARRLGALLARIEASAARYLLLACHHHPLPVGSPWLDKDCIPEGRRVVESCAAEPRVRGLVFGHVHQEVVSRCGAMSVLGTPSTCFQFAPRSVAFSVDHDPDSGRPGCRWLRLGDDGSLDSEVMRVAL